MLCRNFFCLKSNQYFWFSSSNSWYILVVFKCFLISNFTPHFTLLKFFPKWQFGEILKLPFSPVFTRVSHEFCMYFQTTYYRPVAGAVTELRQRCRAVRRVPPTPVFPHSRADGVSGQPPALGLPDVSEMYLKISAVSLAAPEEMRYITPGHPASGKYHTGNNISAYI